MLPGFANVVRLADVAFKEFLFQQLGSLIAIVKQHIRPYLDQILELVKEHWMVNSPLQITIIFLIEHVALALGAWFKMYLPPLVPLILRVLTHDGSKDRSVTGTYSLSVDSVSREGLASLSLLLVHREAAPGRPEIRQQFGGLLAPAAATYRQTVRRHRRQHQSPLEKVDLISDWLNLSDFASRIIQPLIRCVESTSDLRPVAMETLASPVAQLGKKYQNRQRNSSAANPLIF